MDKQEIIDALEAKADEWLDEAESEYAEKNTINRAIGHSRGYAAAAVLVEDMLRGYKIVERD